MAEGPFVVGIEQQPTTDDRGRVLNLRTPNLGQTIIFQIEYDAERAYTHYRMYPIHTGDTVYSIVAKKLRSPEKVDEVRKLNHIASARTVLRHKPVRKKDFARNHGNRLRLPGTLAESARFEVYASLNGEAPTIVGGYAKLEIVDRPGRTGISHFTGYDPGQMDIPITFEGFRPYRQGVGIEDDCQLLERMAGRGDFKGASVGPPSVIRIKTLNSDGTVNPLIPHNWQWATDNEQAPVWRISNIDWDRNPIRNGGGNRIRQHATVSVQAYTRTHTVARSVVKRSQSKNKKPSIGAAAGKAVGGAYKH